MTPPATTTAWAIKAQMVLIGISVGLLMPIIADIITPTPAYMTLKGFQMNLLASVMFFISALITPLCVRVRIIEEVAE